MLTKEHIINLKKTDSGKLSTLINLQSDVRSINFVLENLGSLPKEFDYSFLFDLLDHEHRTVRLNAVKNVAKLSKNIDFTPLKTLYEKETETIVKREIISAFGRQKQRKYIPFFMEILEEQDAKIISQAVRSLLVFDQDKQIQNKLKKFINHPNEMVRTLIYKQYFSKKIRSKIPHTQTYEFLKNKIVQADVLEVLKYVPQDSIHLTFTSPPYYNARDYSIYPSYQAYLEFLEKVFKGIHRITKQGRFLIVNTSPIIIPRISRAHSSKRYPIPFDLHAYIVKNGWEFIDDIIWLKPQTSVKNRIGGFMQHRKPLGYKPNSVTEYLMVYRKQTTKLLDWNIRNYDHQTVDESRVPDDYERSNVWKIDPSFDKVHSAVFPMELCKKVIQYYSYKGDMIFDPFAGSGTLGIAAQSLNRLFFLTEQNTDYAKYIKNRMKTNTLFEKQNIKFETLEEFIKSTQQ